ncbi:MAG: HDIG domain-containing metalloprotein [Thermodesulfobacteriota bacterium]
MATVLARDHFLDYPLPLQRGVAEAARHCRQPIYVAGGPVRDWLLGLTPADLDLTVASGAFAWARRLATQLGAAFVPLDEQEDVARVVWQGRTIDVSSFRRQSRSIEEDLRLRDFTANAMAVEIAAEQGALASLVIIDPTGGAVDLAERRLRMACREGFAHDPLRMLRAARFLATLGFGVEPETRAAIAAHREMIRQVAGERLGHECELILSSSASHAAMVFLHDTGLLAELFPDLAAGQGMSQPDSHHLDVLGHSLEALRCLDTLLVEPGLFFPGHGAVFAQWLDADPKRAPRVRWAALLHDIGKPVTHAIREGRITFHNHDQAGADLLHRVAARFRWPRREEEWIGRLVGLHMWPFHLSNVRRKNGVSRRACLRLGKAVGDDLAGLFLLAMADSLAGNGPGKPAGMEAELSALFAEVHQVWAEHIRPVLSLPPLVTGHDLKELFQLVPGPIFGEILANLEVARVEGVVFDRDQAIAWVRDFLDNSKC